MTDEQEVAFWLFGVVFWIIASLLGRRAMRNRVADGDVSQREVDAFARGFAVSLCGLSFACAAACFIGGDLGDRLLGLFCV